MDTILKCKEHQAPLIICNIGRIKSKNSIEREIRLVCPVDQQLETMTLELKPEELEGLYLSLADKIFRCEKCFRETEIIDIVITKKIVKMFISCAQHGPLIIREIAADLYDKIKYAWDTKDIKVEEERIY